ncbi:HEAT repeat domain-containing protein [Catellatospora sichuanensis]|uniref:HEAT repeat domain-containing protein n=1 Tax=Catellatospora sichuanensis TaxID=1969805 RepID=UPI001C92B613|nr:HEAT repeat domain-containing protein [Catellatospora sichuanensis]
MISSEQVFDQAVSAWQAEPRDGGAVDALLVAIVRPDPASAVDQARAHLAAADDAVRGVAWQLLANAAQLGEKDVQHDVAGLAIAAYAGEECADVLDGIAWALGCAREARGLPALIVLAGCADAGVRTRVSVSLPSVMDDPPEEAGVAALIRLTTDPDQEVRNWATFALGRLTAADSAAVRAALWARIDDPYGEARDEAVAGLAHRGDRGVLPVLAALLARPSAGGLLFDAAALLADPSLLALLREFDVTDDQVRAAVEACDPQERARRDRLDAELREAVAARLPQAEVVLRHLWGSTERELRVTVGGDEVWYDADSLLRRASGDPQHAARLVRADVGSA